MNEAYQTARVVRFGVFEADLRTAELRKQGVRIRLSGQSFQILESLLLRPGELVTRDELKQKLWPSDSFGDLEHGLNAAVNRVREALGDSSENPRFVETLPRRGYRFIAPVEENSNGAGETPPLKSDWAASETQPAQDSNGAGTAGRSRPQWAIKLSLAVLAVLFLLSASGALLFMRYKNRQEQKAGQEIQEEVRITPLTTLPGAAMSPAFSPDGSQVVFAWDGGNSYASNPFDLYVKVIGSDEVEQLTHLPAQWIATAWSPDGSTIAFLRKGGEKPGIFSISARGGPERKLADITFNHAKGGLSWSSDARQLLYPSGDGVDVLTLESGEIHPLDLPSQCKGGGYAPAFSPDGKWAAFPCTHYSTSFTTDLYLLSLKGDPARDLFRVKGPPDRLAWSTDSQRIIFAPYGEPFSFGDLLEINIKAGKTRHLAFAQDAFEPAIAPRGERLAFVKSRNTVNIWRADFGSGLSRNLLAPRTRQQMAPHISPDGKRIAFESNRSGQKEVWAANLDGSDAVQLSNFRAFTGSPRWSPDGQEIVFDSRVLGEPALFLVDPKTALPKQIATNGIPASVPSWSIDGKWIYFRSSPVPSAPEGLYRVAHQGGTPELVSRTVGYNVQQSKDGRVLYFIAGEYDAAIHVLNIATGEEQPLKGMPVVCYPTDWVVGSKGIFFIDCSSNPTKIGFFDFSSARVTRRIPLEKPPVMWSGLALSPDETWVAYSQIDEIAADLMLVDGFR